MTFQLAKPQEPLRAVFDLETLDIQPTGVVLSFGATIFRITDQDSFEDLVDRGTNIIFDVASQKERGSTVSEATLEWWTQQSQEAQDAVLNGTVDPAQLRHILSQTFGELPLSKTLWYCRGPHFDAAMIDNMGFNFGLPSPWSYKNIRDIRTWFDFHPKFVWGETQKSFVAHNSLHDSAMEAYNMQQCWSLYYD